MSKICSAVRCGPKLHLLELDPVTLDRWHIIGKLPPTDLFLELRWPDVMIVSGKWVVPEPVRIS